MQYILFLVFSVSESCTKQYLDNNVIHESNPTSTEISLVTLINVDIEHGSLTARRHVHNLRSATGVEKLIYNVCNEQLLKALEQQYI